MKTILLKIDDKAYDKLNSVCRKGTRNNFILDAIYAQLGRKQNELSEEIDVFKNLKEFNPNKIQRSLLDNELIVQTLYEEIKKQNEILKIILRRATISAGFSKQLIDNASALEQKIVNQVNDEINKINI